MFEERILQLKTQMTMFTLVFIDIFDSMYFGFVSFQNKSVAHFLTTFVTFDSSVNLMNMSFQKTWSSKTSGTLFTVKWGTFFMIFHYMFFQVATTWKLLVTKFTLVSIGFWWNWRSVGMHTPFKKIIFEWFQLWSFRFDHFIRQKGNHSLYLVQLIKHPILRIPNFNFRNLMCFFIFI